MTYYKISIVIFFSFILIFSMYANIPKNAYATSIEYYADHSNFNTWDYVQALILNLPHLFRCDVFPWVGDFVTSFSDLYVYPLQKANNLPTADLPKSNGYPFIVGGTNPDEFEVIAKPDTLVAGPDAYVMGFDHCQDGFMNPTEGDMFHFDSTFTITALDPKLKPPSTFNLIKKIIKDNAKDKAFWADFRLIRTYIEVATNTVLLYAMAKVGAQGFISGYGAIASKIVAETIEKAATLLIEGVWLNVAGAYIKTNINAVTNITV